MKILKYLDLFGIYFHFYIGNKRKLYTSYGGIISLICLFFCLCIFFMLTLKDLLHKNPISNSSSISQAGHHKIKFEKEKLWIPWRIIDSHKKVVNYQNILYPKIYIMKGEKNNENRFAFNTQQIKYELCNETKFAEIGDHHYIDASLNELYCVDFDDIELGGGWNGDYLYYIKLDIDICNDETEGNKTCSLFEDFMKDGTWAIEYFYPIVEYQPTNYENPILVIYKNHFYDFNKFLSKEERIYFQEYILNDDKGLVFNDDLNSSFWGYTSSDFDILYSKTDFYNESISSKIYSLSIFIDDGKILYARRYNKIYTIVANVFPIFNAIFLMFDYLTYMIKTIMTEKYLSELFFQRINENDKIELHQDKRKSTNFFFFNRNYKINLSSSKEDSNKNIMPIDKTKKRTSLYCESIEKKKNKTINSDFSCKSSDNKYDSRKINRKEKNNNEINNDEINNDEINNDDISDISNNQNISKKMKKKISNNINNISKNSSKLTDKSHFENFNNKLRDLISNNNIPKINCNNNSSNINSSFCPFGSPKRNNFIEMNFKNANNNYKKKDYKNQTINNDITNIGLNQRNKMGFEEKKLEFEDYSENNDKFNFYKNKGFNNSAIITRFRLKGSLFKMKDYIYSFFVKAVRKKYKFLSDEFAAIFNFLSDIYDISSYLQLYKQFHIISGFLLDNVASININHKININNKDLFEQVRLKNKNVFYFALKEQFNQNNSNNK